MTMRCAKARAAVLALSAVALAASPAWAASPFDPLDPADPSQVYCDEGADGGATGEATTDREHSRILPRRRLPENVKRRTLRAAGTRTVVLKAGRSRAREAVVFLHGNPGSSGDWVRLLSASGRVGRAVALDLPGFGRAGDAAGYPYTVNGAARFVGAALRKLHIRHAHLVLHDFGGPFGLQWAAGHPARVQSVTLFDTGVLRGYLGHPAAHVWRTPIVGEAFMAALTRESFRRGIQNGQQRPLPRRFVDRMYDDFDRATRCAVMSYYRDVDDPDALGAAQTAALRPRDIPALVIWGRHDPYIPASYAARQREAFPSAKVRIFDASAHWPFVDERKRAKRLLVSFLRGEVKR
jgi:pimeloyl-ACP methyl ester carboxylesterase